MMAGAPFTPRATPGTDAAHDVDADAPDARPLVYFFCIGNAMRSQMAEAFLRRHAGQRFRVASAGTHPLGYVLPEVVQVMRERDIDVRMHESTDIDPDTVSEATYLIDLGGRVHERIPGPLLTKLTVWRVQDPYGMGLRTLRAVRDQIEGLVKDFVAQQGTASGVQTDAQRA